MKRIAVMLPNNYRGGSLRAAKNIAKSLALAARNKNFPVQICFSFVAEGNYDYQEDFSDLLDMNIDLRETHWEHVTPKIMNSVIQLLHLEEKITGTDYLIPKDGTSDFFDCDLWIIISDRTIFPIFPLKKYINVVYDYIQRYVPEIFDDDTWRIQEQGFFKTTKLAEKVFVTTKSTLNDLVSYCGVPKSKINLINMDFTPISEITTEQSYKLDYPYFVWVTNTAQHKNHYTTLEGIAKYFSKANSLECVVLGENTKYFSPKYQGKNEPLWKDTYISSVRQMIDSRPELIKKLHFLGSVSDSTYVQVIKGSSFLLHSCIYDNGTFSVLDAAYLGRSALSSKYPAMEFMNEHFHLNLRFFNPFNATDLANMLENMSNEYSKIKLPAKEDFYNYSWEANADKLFENVMHCL